MTGPPDQAPDSFEDEEPNTSPEQLAAFLARIDEMTKSEPMVVERLPDPVMLEEGFATPEEAAVTDFPPEYVSVESVTYSRDGNHATVNLLTNEEPFLYPYYVYCERDENGRWVETHSSN